MIAGFEAGRSLAGRIEAEPQPHRPHPLFLDKNVWSIVIHPALCKLYYLSNLCHLYNIQPRPTTKYGFRDLRTSRRARVRQLAVLHVLR
jgi:hypothetical protein